MVARNINVQDAPSNSRRVRACWRALAVPAVAFSLFAASCGGGGEEPGKVTLTFANWAAAETATRPGIQEAIKKFEASHPNIDIESEAISFSEIAHQLVLRTRSGNPPDIAELAGNDTFLLAEAGALEPLDSYLGADLKSTLNTGQLEVLQYDGKLTAFPWTVAPTGLWYNKKILKRAGLDPNQPPATIDELMAAMAKIKQSQPEVIPLGLDTTNRPFVLSSSWAWMLAFGAKPIGPQGPAANTAAMKDYLSWMRELADKGYIQPGRKIGDFRPLAAQGKVAFLWDQVLAQKVIQEEGDFSAEAFNDTFAFAKPPVGPSGEAYSTALGHQLVMFEASEHKEEAWEFIRWLSTSPWAVENYTIGYEVSLPPFAEAPNEKIAGLLDTPSFESTRQNVLPVTVIPPYGAEFSDAATAIMAGVQQAVTGDKPIDQIANSIQQRLKQ